MANHNEQPKWTFTARDAHGRLKFREKGDISHTCTITTFVCPECNHGDYKVHHSQELIDRGMAWQCHNSKCPFVYKFNLTYPPSTAPPCEATHNPILRLESVMLEILEKVERVEKKVDDVPQSVVTALDESALGTTTREIKQTLQKLERLERARRTAPASPPSIPAAEFSGMIAEMQSVMQAFQQSRLRQNSPQNAALNTRFDEFSSSLRDIQSTLEQLKAQIRAPQIPASTSQSQGAVPAQPTPVASAPPAASPTDGGIEAEIAQLQSRLTDQLRHFSQQLSAQGASQQQATPPSSPPGANSARAQQGPSATSILYQCPCGLGGQLTFNYERPPNSRHQIRDCNKCRKTYVLDYDDPSRTPQLTAR